jgi:2-polyprenyl-6-methoxyphenol hydroxylase-like FAD-dependent oxidoreductase
VLKVTLSEEAQFKHDIPVVVMTKPGALIVRAGIAGLASARWLDKAGWQSIVIERAETFRIGGYTMTISRPGYKDVKHMNLLGELQSRSSRMAAWYSPRSAVA